MTPVGVRCVPTDSLLPVNTVLFAAVSCACCGGCVAAVWQLCGGCVAAVWRAKDLIL